MYLLALYQEGMEAEIGLFHTVEEGRRFLSQWEAYRSEVRDGWLYEWIAVDEVPDYLELELAKAYNDTLDPSRLSDPYSDKEKEGIAEYARMLEVEEKIGFVSIPKIDQALPVYAGTNDGVLERGCGHLEGTSLPIGERVLIR